MNLKEKIRKHQAIENSKVGNWMKMIKEVNSQMELSQEPSFVTGDIRCYVDMEHTRSVLLEEEVTLLRTHQSGYVPMIHFPIEIRNEEERQRAITICQRITELEEEGISSYYGAMVATGSMIATSFKKGDIILGDSYHTESGIYKPYVDEKFLEPNETSVHSSVKKLIKEQYKR